MEELSDKDRNFGKRCFLNLVSIDALTFVTLTDNAIILYALKLGIPDYIVGVFASFVFIGTAFMIGGKYFIIKYGAAKTISYTIFLKGLFPLLSALAPVAIYRFSSINFAIILFLISIIGFQICRGMGALAGLPIIGEITTDEDRSNYFSNIFTRFHSSYLLGLIFLSLVLKHWDSVRTFQLIICSGSILCCLAAFFGSRIKESDAPRNSAKTSIKEALFFVLKYSKSRELVLSQTLYFIAVALISPYSMIALKEVYGIKDSFAIIFAVVLLGGGVLISLNAGRVINKIGPRKLFVTLFFALLAVAFLWYNAPQNFNLYYCIILFLVLGVGQVGCILALNNNFLNIIPADRRVGSNLVILSTSSFIGGVFGACVGPVTLKFLEKHYFLNGLTMYRAYFSIVLLFLLIGYLYILKAEEVYVLRLTKAFVVATIKRKR